jgi:hypothetical protein
LPANESALRDDISFPHLSSFYPRDGVFCIHFPPFWIVWKIVKRNENFQVFIFHGKLNKTKLFHRWYSTATLSLAWGAVKWVENYCGGENCVEWHRVRRNGKESIDAWLIFVIFIYFNEWISARL